MKLTYFPTLEEALYLHQRLIQRFGGDEGVKDLGLLESALRRPQFGYYKSLSEQAAALMQSLARNHVFVDGNKRMSFALTEVFLKMNGYRLRVSADEGERFLIDQIITSHVEVPDIAAWLERYMTSDRSETG